VLVVLPHDAELDDALGDLDDLKCLLVLGVLLEEGRQRALDLVQGLARGSVRRQRGGGPRCTAYLLELGLGGKVGHGG
jgi:hypothetical protein